MFITLSLRHLMWLALTSFSFILICCIQSRSQTNIGYFDYILNISFSLSAKANTNSSSNPCLFIETKICLC